MTQFDWAIPTPDSPLGEIKQIAFVVDDLARSIEICQQQHGIGPWVFFTDESPLQGSLYRGQPSERVVMDAAFAYKGDLQIELIQLKNAAPSMYQEVIARGQKNLQHYGVLVADFERAIQYATDNGFTPIVQSGAAGFAQMWYMEATDFSKNVFAQDQQSFMQTPEGHGIVLEIIEDNPYTRPYFDGIRKLVDDIPADQLTQQFTINALMARPSN